MSNSDNPSKGGIFQQKVMEWFQANYETKFELEKKIPIGKPEKVHKFNIMGNYNSGNNIAIECKRIYMDGKL